MAQHQARGARACRPAPGGPAIAYHFRARVSGAIPATGAARRQAIQPFTTNPADFEDARIRPEERATPIAVRHPKAASPGLAVFLVVWIGFAFGYALIASQGDRSFADEGFHAPQVRAFFERSYQVEPQLTTLPTYHLVLAMLSRAAGRYDLNLVRFFSMIIGASCVLAFAALVRREHPGGAAWTSRVLEFVFLPILFPFFFLVYTDVWSLSAVLATVWLTLSRRRALAGVAGLLAVALRQTSIVWVGFALLLALLDEPETRDAQGRRSARRMLLGALRAGWPFFVVGAVFCVFVIVNRGVSLGDRTVQQATVNPTNLYFFLTCAGWLFLPYNLSKLRDVARLARRPVVMACIVLGLPAFLLTYRVTHPYNVPGLDFFLRNQFLNWMVGSMVGRAVMYVPLCWMVLSICTVRWPDPRWRWLLAFVPLSILPYPLIEQRYYLPALALLLAAREPRPAWIERATVLLYAAVSAYFLFGIATERFFL